MKESRQSGNRSFAALLAVATLAHLCLLLIPVVRQQQVDTADVPTVSVRFSRPEPVTPPPEPIPEPEPLEFPALRPVELAELPEPEPQPTQTAPEQPRFSASRIILELQEKRNSDPLAAPTWEREPARPDYYARHQPVLEDVLNEPSMQLPFRDTRVYLVDYYEDGFLGGMDRFFDDVTVPFGFTTKNNTRIQCAWILVLAGCSWGDVSYYYAADKAKKRNPNPL